MINQPSQKHPEMKLMRKLELPLALTLLVGGAAFLMKMCYLSLFINTVFGIVFLAGVHLYLRSRLGLNIPLSLLLLVFMALQIDALGNYFRMYGHQFGPMQFDEFSHMTVQILVSPVIVWLVQSGLQRREYHLPLPLTAFFAATTVFSISAAYEIIELWDELYAGGKRIWGPYDTATDLQWDLCGLVIGTLLACFLLRTGEVVRKTSLLTDLK